jgi:hypothetical protein
VPKVGATHGPTAIWSTSTAINRFTMSRRAAGCVSGLLEPCAG